MSNFINIKLDVESSNLLLSEIEKLDSNTRPVSLHPVSPGEFVFYVGGSNTIHTLTLRPDGTWRINTAVEV